MFRKLRKSVMLFNVITVTLIILSAFIAIYFITFKDIEAKNQQRLQAVSNIFYFPNIMPLIEATGSTVEIPTQFDNISLEIGISFVLFIDNGNLINISSQLDLDESIYEEAFEKVGTAKNGKISFAGRKWLFSVAEDLPVYEELISDSVDNDFERIIFLDITDNIQILRTLIITLGCVGISMLLVLIWISFIYATRAVRPIEISYNKQKQFITDASHELRTPLTVISANIDAIMASGDETVNSQNEWFGYIRSELKRTEKLVNELLYLAKSENIRSGSDIPFNLSVACEMICASMEALLYDSGKSLKADIAKDIYVVADKVKIDGVMQILLDNASKYTPADGQITLTLKRENNNAVLRIKNTGVEIPEADLPLIFERFYRVDVSRSTETGGTGLGLSIAKTIIENSGGMINAESKDGYTTFTVSLRLQKYNPIKG